MLSTQQRTRLTAGALFFLLLLTGCASLPPPPMVEAVQIANVPAYEQDALQCGPAALASVLNASDVMVTPDELTPDLFIPERKGSLQIELAAQTRQRQRVPLVLEPSETQLMAALKAGQPALVLLNLRVRSYPAWHYAVVTGYDPLAGYTVNNGKAEPEQVPRRRFLRQWQWAGQWAMTVHRADQPPAYVSANQWIAAAAPLGRSHALLAEEAYRAATQQWSEQPLPWAALADAQFARGDAESAVSSLQRAAQLAPDDAAIANNLASVQLARGCVNAARQVLDRVDMAAAAPAIATALQGTLQELAAAGPDHCPH